MERILLLMLMHMTLHGEATFATAAAIRKLRTGLVIVVVGFSPVVDVHLEYLPAQGSALRGT